MALFSFAPSPFGNSAQREMEIVTMSHRYRRVRQDTAVIQAAVQIALEQAQAAMTTTQTQVDNGTSARAQNGGARG
jgi:hypothetical protein